MSSICLSLINALDMTDFTHGQKCSYETIFYYLTMKQDCIIPLNHKSTQHNSSSSLIHFLGPLLIKLAHWKRQFWENNPPLWCQKGHPHLSDASPTHLPSPVRKHHETSSLCFRLFPNMCKVQGSRGRKTERRKQTAKCAVLSSLTICRLSEAAPLKSWIQVGFYQFRGLTLGGNITDRRTSINSLRSDIIFISPLHSTTLSPLSLWQEHCLSWL